MKLRFENHNELYAVEQTLMALFPEEKPEYGDIDPVSDTRWAVISIQETDAICTVTVEMSLDGKQETVTLERPLSGTAFEKVGQRRRTISMTFFKAAQAITGIAPAWGSLTGVRPDKVAQEFLKKGCSPQETQAHLEKDYFVTPARAELATQTGIMGQIAKANLRDARDIALYVGIPFCPSRCAYCSFVSASVERSFDLVEPYVEGLLAELRAGGAMTKAQNLRPRSFYMGGGTPTTLSADQLDRVLTCLEESFDLRDCQELTVEAGRPDTITEQKLSVLCNHHVTRVSVNPQTMEPHVLKAIGRNHNPDDIVNALKMVKRFDFPHVNMDLIAGLPQDTAEGFRRSLDTCLELDVDNITIHTLSLKKGSRLLEEHLRIPPAEEVAAMLDYAAPTLRAAGYDPYYLYRQKYMSGSFENVGWTKNDGVCWYNIQIMSELCTILSFGAGGSTKLVGNPNRRMERCFNLKYPLEYIQRPEKWQQNQDLVADFYSF